MKVGEMNTVAWKLINPQGKVIIISPDWNTLLRIFVNGNRSIKILEMGNELKKKVDWNQLLCTIMERYTVLRKNICHLLSGIQF